MGYKYKAHTHLAWLEKISITYLGMSVFPESVEEKKIGENLLDLGLSKQFLDLTPKA